MERYHQNWNRRRAHESQVEHGQVFSFEQIRDVCELLKAGEWPDGTWSDNECNLWSLLRQEFDLKVR